MNSRVSIITPSYQHGSFLRDAIESVRFQGVADCEHIVVDGGSTDASVKVLEQQPSIRWVSEPDEGQSDAFNKGLAMCQGDIIGWMNADDFLLEGALDTVLKIFAADPTVDVLFGDCVFVDEEGKALRLKSEHPLDAGVLLHYGCFIPTTSTFFSRRVRESGLLRLRTDLHFVMDHELFLRLLRGGAQFRYVPMPLAAFRWHTANKSHRADERVAERHRVQREYLDVYKSDLWLELSRRAYRAKHLFMKVNSGGLRRQVFWARKRGTDMRWWPEGV